MASSSSSFFAASSVATKLSAPTTTAASPRRRPGLMFFRVTSKPKLSLFLPRYKDSNVGPIRSTALKAQLNEVVSGNSNSVAAPALSDSEKQAPMEKDPSSPPLSEQSISEFMAQVSELVKLVDSKDIVELQLKQLDCELIIRKKEALPQPPAPTVVVQQTSPPQANIPIQYPPLAAPNSPPSPPPASASVPLALPAPPKQAKPSHPPLKSPMAGTFYKSPGPGLPPFIKVGDKVNKGQVLCIIEAMKLMNEIEADRAGTIVEILAEDGKPVGIEQPLFIIEP